MPVFYTSSSDQMSGGVVPTQFLFVCFMRERDSNHGGEECPAQAKGPFCILEEIYIEDIKRGLKEYV